MICLTGLTSSHDSLTGYAGFTGALPGRSRRDSDALSKIACLPQGFSFIQTLPVYWETISEISKNNFRVKMCFWSFY
jgi:hypothetical protein